MKRLIFLLILISVVITAGAQTVNIDTALKFDKVITAYEQHWVVLKKPVAVPYYTFGYVYIQSDKGFMFKEAGHFKVDKNNQYVLCDGKWKQYRFSADDADQSSPARVIRLRDTIGGQNPRQITLPLATNLSSKHFKELKIETKPKWLKPYYTFTDTLEHNYRWGCYHSEEIDLTTGIAYFEKVYKVSPHYKGVIVPMDHADWYDHQGIELKLSAAYKNTRQYDKAIGILKAAILNDPAHIPFYQELIFTYNAKEDWNMVIETAKQGLAKITVEKSDQKRDFAAWAAKGYEELKNDVEGKKWRVKSLEYSLCPGCVY
ncbi:MAG: hypothetical protein V4553_18550 [Bacteroidota bacterium]